mmetsp:Transcript_34909/g.94578  ORF Transcript_34909/g.94578 Transcript_34909/m.94578 type:complete len:215 (+) Transcript_34909:945-1589(+)
MSARGRRRESGVQVAGAGTTVVSMVCLCLTRLSLATDCRFTSTGKRTSSSCGAQVMAHGGSVMRSGPHTVQRVASPLPRAIRCARQRAVSGWSTRTWMTVLMRRTLLQIRRCRSEGRRLPRSSLSLPRSSATSFHPCPTSGSSRDALALCTMVEQAPQMLLLRLESQRWSHPSHLTSSTGHRGLTRSRWALVLVAALVLAAASVLAAALALAAT